MTEQIPYHRPYPLSTEDRVRLLGKIDEVLISGQLTNGEYCRQLEDQIKKMYNVDYCLTTSNCTTGLLISLALGCLHIQTTAFNWWSDLYISKRFLKRNTSFLDINLGTWLPEKGNPFFKQLYLHTFGNIGDSECGMNVYDASHCLGAKLKDIGLATIFSLAPTKLVTSCEGGLLITNREQDIEDLKELRDKCCRMSEIHALVGLATLKHLDKIKKWKRDTYEFYKKNIPGQFQEIPFDSSYNTIGFLNMNELEIPEHIQYKQYYEPIQRGLPNTEHVYEKMVCLPSYYGAPTAEIVVDILELNDRKITKEG